MVLTGSPVMVQLLTRLNLVTFTLMYVQITLLWRYFTLEIT